MWQPVTVAPMIVNSDGSVTVENALAYIKRLEQALDLANDKLKASGRL